MPPEPVAIVTGGARRLGRFLAEALAEAGLRVVVHCHDSLAEAQTLVAQAQRRQREMVAVQADLTKSSGADAVIGQALASFGRLDLLVNSAAIYESLPFEELGDADFDRVLAINLRGPFCLSRRAGRVMREQEGGGLIVNITCTGAERPWKHHTPYCVSKAGLAMLTRSLAVDLAPKVRVNAIAPGPILPPEDYDEEDKAIAADETLLRRWGHPRDIATALLYLLYAPYVTGETIHVDGGRLLR